MRPDMAKVVTERPRAGHGNRSKKTARRLTADEIYDAHSDEHEFDAGPSRASASRARHEWPKMFTDVLNPLRGYLRKQVGRPWAKVWSELSANLDKRSITGQHIFDHIKSEVEQDCWKGVSGKVYANRYGGEVTGLYVDPITHLLRYKVQRSYRSHVTYATRQDFRRFAIGDDFSKFRIADKHTLWEHTEHGWFIHRYRDVPERVELIERSDGTTLKRVHPARIERYASKQASKKELRDARPLLDKEPK